MGFQPIVYRYGQVQTMNYPEQRKHKCRSLSKKGGEGVHKHPRHQATPIIRQYYVANSRPVNDVTTESAEEIFDKLAGLKAGKPQSNCINIKMTFIAKI
ncbi:hypothetical protein ACTXT7_005041 [Hymenolepis weldensis]